MNKTRLKTSEITLIVTELERWREGQLGSKLTWDILAKNFGYSRQALQAHLRIKSAFQDAKTSLRMGVGKNREKLKTEIDLLEAKVTTLESLIKDFEKKEIEWLKKWQRIAYHIRAKGLNYGEFDREINSVPNKKAVSRIISVFDKPLPPNGRT